MHFKGYLSLYPKVDDGISSTIVMIHGYPIPEQRVRLGPIGTKIAENLANLGAKNASICFDSVNVYGPRFISRVSIVKAICTALGWDSVDLYDLQCDNYLGTVSTDRPIHVRVDNVAGKPGFRTFHLERPVDEVVKAFNFYKPPSEKEIAQVPNRTQRFVRAILAIPGIRELFIGKEEIIIFLRAGYPWSEVDSGVRNAFRMAYPEVVLRF